MEGFFSASGGCVFETHHQAANGNVVLNERTDYVNTGAGWVALPVCGVFEIRDGRIARWSDCFDRGTVHQHFSIRPLASDWLGAGAGWQREQA